eukprot:1194352-Prorocentrum_minimum.AAC.5
MMKKGLTTIRWGPNYRCVAASAGGVVPALRIIPWVRVVSGVHARHTHGRDRHLHPVGHHVLARVSRLAGGRAHLRPVERLRGKREAKQMRTRSAEF